MASLPSCPYCQSISRFFVSSTDRNRRTTTEVFHYFQCENCNLVFMDPIPANLIPFYEGGYGTIPRSLSELRQLAAAERYRMDPILKFKTSGRLLEIGPWRGAFSCNAKDAGFDVTVIEMDTACVDFLNNIVGIKALHSSDPVAALNSLDEKFDVIVLWHSLEHLRSPWLVIAQAAAHLAPGGILLVAIPNIESYQYSVLKAAWKHLDAPRHLFLYPADSLIKLCQTCGLSTLETTTNDQLSRALSKDAWRDYANSLIPIRRVRGALGLLMGCVSRKRENSPNAGAGLTAIFQLPPSVKGY
jgi:2-polyprenyl-3-methyl-5-hydroxy-6-metoxy-1,4-benzoquinol methylase